jgi:hypothetical protein
MQINSGSSESGASPPKGDGVILTPLGTKTFTLTGPALTSFLNRATAIGYKFLLSGPSYDGAYPCQDDHVVDNPSVLRVVTGYSSDPGFTETRTARLFQRVDPFLNPFWRMTAVAVADSLILRRYKSRVGLPLSRVCLLAGPSNSGHLISLITSVTLVGPDDKTPEDALFPPPRLLPATRDHSFTKNYHSFTKNSQT